MLSKMKRDKELVKIESSDGGFLVGSWSNPSGVSSNFPLVILATGDGPNGSSGQTWTQLVSLLNQQGIGTFLFDFSGLGNSPGVYRDLTLTKGCQNFRDVVNFVMQNGHHDMSRVGVIGSSFGGNVALLEAANCSSIAAVGLKSASTFLPEGYEHELGPEKMVKWAKDNYLDEVDHTYDIVEDSLFHNTYEAASRINVPVRIVHGTADSSVPIRHARDLLRILPTGSILEIEGADHWYAEGNEWQVMADDLVTFMAEVL